MLEIWKALKTTNSLSEYKTAKRDGIYYIPERYEFHACSVVNGRSYVVASLKELFVARDNNQQELYSYMLRKIKEFKIKYPKGL
jgi:hypothetical protein